MSRLQGRVAIITGASSGIGEAIAEAFAREGVTVVIAARRAERLAALAERITKAGGVAIARACDARSEDDIEALFAFVDKEFGKLDLLVNSAGIADHTPTVDLTLERWRDIIDTNLTSTFLCCRAAMRRMIAQKRGRIINIGSIDGMRIPDFNNYSYTASKAAVHMLTRVLAKELGQRHITVNAIAPGPFPSKMMAELLVTKEAEFAASSPLGRIGKSEDMEAAAVYLASPGAAWVTGVILPVDGGIWTTL